MSTYDLVSGLALEIEGYALDGLARTVSSNFERRTTVVRLAGAGEEGIGEDVTYAADEHERAQAAGPVLPLAGRGRWTRSPSAWASSTSSPTARPSSPPSASTGAGPTRARRSTSRCARPAARSRRRSPASRGR